MMNQRKVDAWILLAPAVVLVAIVAVYPIARTIMLAFFTQNLGTNLEPEFSGVSNFVRIAHDGHYWETVVRTFTFTAIAVGLEVILGIGLALAIHHSPFGRGLARTAALVPWVLPTAALSLAWIWIFNDQFGIVNNLLVSTGFLDRPIAWLGRPDTAFSALVFADVWKTTPFITLLVLAALQTIPHQFYEAAAIDGAPRIQQFLQITLPAIQPTIFIAVLFRALQSFGIFDLVYIMTGGGPGGATETVAVYTYRNFMRYLDFGYGAALLTTSAFLLALLSAGIFFALRPRS